MQTLEVNLDVIQSLTEKAEFEKAFVELHEVFAFLDERSLDEINDEKSASILILCGLVISSLAFQKQKSCQKQAIEILSKALSVFSNSNNWIKMADTSNALGFCCWREDSLKEAESWLNASLEMPIDSSSPIRLQTYNFLSLVLLYGNRDDEALSVLRKIEKNLQNYKDENFLARFHNNYGLALRNRGREEEVISHYLLSSFYLKKTGNRKFQGIVENNLAQLYLSKGNFAEARLHALNSLGIYRKLNDFGHEASSLETFAQIQFNEGDFEGALISINRSIEILNKGVGAGCLIESLLTKCRILTALGRTDDALAVFAAAHELATSKIGEEKAAEVRALFKQYFSDALKKEAPSVQKPESSSEKSKDSFTIVLPVGVESSSNHVVLTLENDNFARFNIPENSLLLVERCDSVPVNAFAVLRDNEDVFHVGFIVYHNDLQLYGLSFCGEAEPIPLDYTEFSIFGLVVAFCPRDEISSVVRMKPLEFPV